jgi:hypothetical protein
VSAQDELGVDPLSFGLDSLDLTRAHVAVVGYLVEPKGSVVPW